MSDSSGVPAAWYPDPLGAPAHRWWDGSGWTEHTRELVVKSAPLAPAPDVMIPDVVVTPPTPPRVLEERRATPIVEVARAAPVVVEAPPVRQLDEPAAIEPPPVPVSERRMAPSTELELHRAPLLPNRRATFVPADTADPAPWIAVVPVTVSRNATATWAFVFGVLAVVTAALAAAHPGALVFSVLALLTGVIGLVRSRRAHRGVKRSVWGIALAIVATAAVVVVWFWFPDADLTSVTWLRL